MNKEELVRELQAKAKKLRRGSLGVMKEMGMGWLGGSFSSADFVTALFFYRMKHDPKRPHWPERDRLIISKGHSCEIFYAALAEAGYIATADLQTYSHCGSRLQTHVDCRTPGIDCSGGSLGLGLSFAVGAAPASALKNAMRDGGAAASNEPTASSRPTSMASRRSRKTASKAVSQPGST